MRMAVLAATTALVLAGGAAAETGASSGVAMQPGRWGARGWQQGADTVPPAPVPSAAPANTLPAPVAAPPIDAAGYPPPAARPRYAATYPASDYAPAAPAPGFGEAAFDAPPGMPHRPVHVGGRLPRGYLDPIYTVHDWRDYGLEQPYAGTRWVRYFDEAVLLDARGRAIAIRPVAWNAPRYRRPTAPLPAPRDGWTPPVASVRTERHGDTVVTTQVIPPPRAYHAGGYGPDYGWGPGVTVTPSIVTTTTTTITDPAPPASRYRRARRR